MVYVKLGESLYPVSISGFTCDAAWDNRESNSVTIEMEHNEAAEKFIDNAAWSIVYQADDYVNSEGETVTPDAIVYDKSDFCVAGDIIDHRNGTVTVKMGKLTDLEETLAIVYGGI